MFKWVILVSAFCFGATAHADVLESMASVFKVDENTNYKSTLDMRSQRKFGVGASVGGNLGVVGMNLELNFEDENSAVAGFGTGPGYNAFAILWKHSFEGDYLAPYTSLGYSRWFNADGNKEDIDRSGTLRRAVSDSDKRAGQFATNFISGSLGLQYNQLSDITAGLSVYTELTLLAEVQQGIVVPTGSVGSVFYF